MSTVTIDYIGHSGFLAETEEVLMLFDYYQGDLSMLDEKPAGKPLFVFASHVHGDHFNPQIFDLAKGERNVTYLLSFDIRKSSRMPEVRGLKVSFLDAGKSYEISGLGTVETLLSTDEGVAFLVETGSAVIYHAGDLNWWDWEEADPDIKALREKRYTDEIKKLAGRRIDIAFAVLDDRLGAGELNGLNRFLSICDPAYVLPMHFWQDGSVVERFKAQTDDPEKILDTARGDHFELNF